MSDTLAALDDCGIRLDDHGQIVDWRDRPAHDSPSFDRETSNIQSRRNLFTAAEDQIIRQWCEAAERESVRGSTVFEQLECLFPRHTWQAYEGRWRRVLRPQMGTRSTVDGPSVDLDVPATPSAVDNASNQPLPALSHTGHLQYADQRIETARVILEKLDLQDESDLARLLKIPWVIQAYAEFAEGSLVPRHDVDATLVARTGMLPRAANGRSQHAWKVDRVMEIIQTFGGGSRYCGTATPDTSSWTDNDHDLRFLVRIVQQGVLQDQLWQQLHQQHGLRAVCERAVWLLLWFRWLWKPSAGYSVEARRQQAKKMMWRGRLEEYRSRRETLQLVLRPRSTSMMHESTTTLFPQLSLPPVSTTVDNATTEHHDHVPDPAEVSSDDTDCWHDARSYIDRSSSDATQIDHSSGEVPLARSTPEVWLSTQVRQIYLNNRDRRLATWGVTAQHKGTCVLVPAEWAFVEPESLLNHPIAWPRNEAEMERLGLSLGSVRPLWARAVAWFEDWPRSQYELAQSVDVSGPLPQGSHLCHHGLCILPSHIVFESKEANLSRNSCHSHARILRMYQVQVPEHCLKHQPPCLLQFAALTTFETLALQFFIFQQARSLTPRAPIEKPTDHPASYRTFEWRLPTQEAFNSVHVDPIHLVQSPSVLYSQPNARFRRHCCFCLHPRVWGKLSAYWSHLKLEHPEISQANVLHEVRTSALDYEQWASNKFYNLERCNPATWAKMVQSKQPDFSWEVFSGWRLHKDRLYNGRGGVE